MNTNYIQDSDVLTITVLLPQDESAREDLYEQVSNNCDFHGGVALAAMHGNAINLIRASDALQSGENAISITKHLSELNQHQIQQAFLKMGSSSAQRQQAIGPMQNTAAFPFKLSLCMFVLGALTAYNFF